MKSGTNPEPDPVVLEYPIEVACSQKGPEAEKIVKLLLFHGAEGDDDALPVFPLLKAYIWSDVSMVNLLLEHDPNLLKKTDQFKENALHCAALNLAEGVDILDFLLKNFDHAYHMITEKNVHGGEPTGVYPLLNCKFLSKSALNGGNPNFSLSNVAGQFPGIIPKCKGEEMCPLRLAQLTLAKTGYFFDSNIDRDLVFHENYNNFSSELAAEDKNKFEAEFLILNCKKIFHTQTLLSFLRANRLQTNRFAKNDRIIKIFMAKEKIYFFEGLITSKMSKACKRLELYEFVYENFSIAIGMILPQDIFEYISKFFTNAELENLSQEVL